MEPIILASDAATDTILELLRAWGITRLSLRWTGRARGILDEVEARGWDVNLYGVPDLETFLEASLLLPASVTADFNFPEWQYFGRGSGAGGSVHEFEEEADAHVDELVGNAGVGRA